MAREWWIDEKDQLQVGRLIAVVLIVVVAVAYIVACGVAQSLDSQRDHWWWQLWAYKFVQDGAWFDVARTTATLVAIPGAAVALVIAFARHRVSQQQVAHATEEAQRVHERELERQKSTDRQLEQAAAESRALEKRELDRRVNEQYVKAVDQIRDGSALARIAGMHALDRLAQDQKAWRTIVVDVWCAYLRIRRPSQSGEVDSGEREVRATCARLMLSHLDPERVLAYWDDQGLRIDLAAADLSTHWDAAGRRFPTDANFANAMFGVGARFDRATFEDRVSFAGATFRDGTRFSECKIGHFASFAQATFTGHATFDRAEMGVFAGFDGATFEDVSFDGSSLGHLSSFDNATFGEEASFDGATIGELTSFNDATFGRGASFDGAVVGNDVSFRNATFGDLASFDEVELGDGVSFGGAKFVGVPPRGLADSGR